jgi:hypothetical protein
MLWEMSVVYGSFECLRDHHNLRDVGFTHIIGTVHHHPLGGAIVVLEVPTEHLECQAGRRRESMLARKTLLPLEPLGWPFAPQPWNGWWSKWRHRPDVVRSSPLAMRQQC